MSKPYFTLLLKEDHQFWTQQFGDYSKAVVKAELDDMHYSNKPAYKRSEYLIIRTAADTRSIEDAIIELNVHLIRF